MDETKDPTEPTESAESTEPGDILGEVVDLLKDGMDVLACENLLALRHGLSSADAKQEVQTAQAIIQNPAFPS